MSSPPLRQAVGHFLKDALRPARLLFFISCCVIGCVLLIIIIIVDLYVHVCCYCYYKYYYHYYDY